MVRKIKGLIVSWLRRQLCLEQIEGQLAVLHEQLCRLEQAIEKRPTVKARDMVSSTRGIPSWRDIQQQVLKEEDSDGI